jgi:hypothetical protein
MSVYVDPMWNHGKRIGRAGPEWCHLLADTAKELHDMADAVGLRRSWFQGDHYDIGSERVRSLALLNGAVELTGRAWLLKVKEIRDKVRVGTW